MSPGIEEKEVSVEINTVEADGTGSRGNSPTNRHEAWQKGPAGEPVPMNVAGEEEETTKGAEDKLVPSAVGPVPLHVKIKIKFIEAWNSSDWVKALLVGPIFCFIPVILFLDICVQAVLKCKGSAVSKGLHTQRGQNAIDYFCGLNLSGIFVRICILGEVAFTLNVLFAKLTYIFLSWLNEKLTTVNFGVVIFLVVLVGFTMFMLPPVPGIPVYVFTGIVVAAQANREGISFTASIIMACCLSVFTKLLACSGQYGIGAFMGGSVKIQQLIGVDKVPTRAIEKLLSLRGLRISKVMILIGGPDWPVSVSCGILKVNIPQMLLGTTPVIFICSPCVVAGACLTKVTGGASDPWVNRSAFAILISTICQGGALSLALFYIGKTITLESEELAKPRPEHAAVEELRRQEQQYNNTMMEVTAWRNMSCCKKANIILAAFLQIFSNGSLTFFSESCFRPFYLSSSIGSPSDGSIYPPGLDGNALKIVRIQAAPLMGLFVLGAVLHFIHCKMAEAAAKKALGGEPSQPAKTAKPQSHRANRQDTE